MHGYRGPWDLLLLSLLLPGHELPIRWITADGLTALEFGLFDYWKSISVGAAQLCNLSVEEDMYVWLSLGPRLSRPIALQTPGARWAQGQDLRTELGAKERMARLINRRCRMSLACLGKGRDAHVEKETSREGAHEFGRGHGRSDAGLVKGSCDPATPAL